MEIQLLKDITIIFSLSIAVTFLFHLARIPAILGFIITGILAGPYGFGLIKALDEVKILAEVGIVLLLFTIGIESSLKNLLQMKKSVLLGGSLQVSLTISASFLIVRHFIYPYNKAVFIGFLISLSSTAIVLKLLQERSQIESPHGRIALGILIFQDIIIVPMILFTPLLAGSAISSEESYITLFLKGAGVILFLIVSTKWIVPELLFQIARTRNQELFLLGIIVICLSVAWLTYSLGLSLALGAFLAGLIISESEYSHQAFGNVLPLRDAFISFFFVSIGMLIDISFFLRESLLIILVSMVAIILKTIIAVIVTCILGFPLRTSVMTGLALCQIGEFSFILSEAGIKNGLLTDNIYQLFLSASVLTMALTPFIISLSPYIADFFQRVPLPEKIKSGRYPIPATKVIDKKNHLIIIGFGINGRNVAKTARVTGIPYVIIEMNPITVRKEKAKGERIFYGDAVRQAVLERADIQNAAVVVVSIADPAATARITATVKLLNPKAYIIIRTRYIKEINELYKLGADEVIPEEFETSVEISSCVLRHYNITKEEIDVVVNQIRADGYKLFSSPQK